MIKRKIFLVVFFFFQFLVISKIHLKILDPDPDPESIPDSLNLDAQHWFQVINFLVDAYPYARVG
jgi:hypothetical protein